MDETKYSFRQVEHGGMGTAFRNSPAHPVTRVILYASALQIAYAQQTIPGIGRLFARLKLTLSPRNDNLVFCVAQHISVICAGIQHVVPQRVPTRNRRIYGYVYIYIYIYLEWCMWSRGELLNRSREGYFGVYFPRCATTREMNIKITLEWAHKQFVIRVHTLSYFLH